MKKEERKIKLITDNKEYDFYFDGYDEKNNKLILFTKYELSYKIVMDIILSKEIKIIYKEKLLIIEHIVIDRRYNTEIFSSNLLTFWVKNY